MNSGVQQKMYDYEVAPPAGAWEKIAAELDESELEHRFPSTLHNLEVMPPALAWQHIAVSLDESAMVNEYAGKLAAIEVAPPVTTWNKIALSLDVEHEAAVPEHRRFSPFIKYAAAAAIIGFLAWGGMHLFNKKIGETAVVKQETSPVNNDNSIATTPLNVTVPEENITVPETTASIEEARNDAALEQSKKTFAKLDATVTRSKIKNAANFFFIPDNYEPTGTRSVDLSYPVETPEVDIANRYIVLMTPDGNIIRMSKKFGNLVCCVSGEEQDKDCVDQMKKWREKIANPSSTHSPGNVMDILSLVSSLQDN